MKAASIATSLRKRRMPVLEAEVTLGYASGFPYEDLPLAEMAYNAYCQHAGWKSLATGQNLPKWNDLKVSIKAGWLAAVIPVKTRVTDRNRAALR